MLLNDRRRSCSPAVVILVVLCLFMSVWHLSYVPDQTEQTSTNINNLLQQGPSSLYDQLLFHPQQIAYYEPINSREDSLQLSFDVQKLPMWDYTTLIDLDEFTFDIINFVCVDNDLNSSENSNSPLLLILVHSTPSNFAKREIIRTTWGQQQSNNVVLLFILGRDAAAQHDINLENSKYHDIIQGSFNDAYRNMTYKHVTTLKYFVYHCPEAKYILKTDDDIFVNIPLMQHFLTNEISPFGARNMLYCAPVYKTYVKRTYRSKWRVSSKEYPYRHYPTYCPGWAIIYSPDVAFKLYDEAQRSEFFWIDDVHITGTLAKRLNITHTPIQLALTEGHTNDLVGQYDHLMSLQSSDLNNQTVNFLVAAPDLPPDSIKKLWSIVQRHYPYSSSFHFNSSRTLVT